MGEIDLLHAPLSDEGLDLVAAFDDLARIALARHRLYVVFRGPPCAVAMELHLAASTDESLQEPMSQLHEEDQQRIRESAIALMPGVENQPGFDAWLLMSVSAIRGMAVATMGIEDVEREWDLLRDRLVESANELLRQESA